MGKPPVYPGDKARSARFDVLVGTCTQDLFRYAFWLCRDRQVAEDLMQETLLRAWRSLDRLKDEAAAKPWLITTLRRENARLYERKRLEMVQIDVQMLPDEWAHGAGGDDDVDELRAAIFALESDYREPLFLQVIMGYTTAEIAELMELSQPAVLTRLFRARNQLRDNMKGASLSRGTAG
jgi:RNA polymerase sigma-70 factor (ECF subfamily)